MREHETPELLARLQESLHYDPDTGVFTWIGPPGKIGTTAGCRGKRGYLHIGFENKKLLGHRVAFAFIHGRWPYGQVDHRDVDPSNDKGQNLREATGSQNALNRPRVANLTGFRGVRKFQGGQFGARAVINGKMTHLGTFNTAEDAARAYDEAARAYHGEFAYTNF